MHAQGASQGDVLAYRDSMHVGLAMPFYLENSHRLGKNHSRSNDKEE
jgi:hypothetical protein